MSKIIFILEPEKVYDGTFQTIGEHQLRLTFDSEIPSNDILLSGFNLVNEYNGFVQTRREDYKYIYRIYEDEPNKVELCNDNIQWVAPPEPEPIPEQEPYVPTYEEVLNNKIYELSMQCQSLIVAGLDINGVHYSYTTEDQQNLKEVFDTVKLTGLPLGYHADGHNCAEYSAEELINIYIQLVMNKYCQQTYFNQVRGYLVSLNESDENKELISNYVYGTPLEGIYLETYNKMVELYNNQIVALSEIN